LSAGRTLGAHGARASSSSRGSGRLLQGFIGPGQQRGDSSSSSDGGDVVAIGPHLLLPVQLLLLPERLRPARIGHRELTRRQHGGKRARKRRDVHAGVARQRRVDVLPRQLEAFRELVRLRRVQLHVPDELAQTLGAVAVAAAALRAAGDRLFVVVLE
jgi:hypothetical protein